MATYEITSPDGVRYEITAPEGATKAQIKAFLLKQSKPQKSSKPEERGSFIDPLMQGLTFGWADELAGIGARLGHALAGGERGAEIEKEETGKWREDLRQQRERAPLSSAAVEIGGSLVSGGPVGKAVKGVKGLIGLGALEGSIAGAGASDEDKLSGALIGGTLGAGAAGTLAGAGSLAGYGKRKLAPVVNRLRESPSTSANRMLMESLESESITPTMLRSRYRQMGPEATLADVGGYKTQGMAQGVVDVSQTGDELAQARRVFAARAKGSTERLRKDIAKATGVKERFLPKMDEINARQKSLSKDAYAKAYQRKINNSHPLLVDLINRPGVRAAIPDAVKNAANEGRKVLGLDALLKAGKDAKISGEMMPDMQAWDEIKRYLDKKVNTAYRTSDTGAHSLRILRDNVRTTLDKLNPDYKGARNIFAGDAALKESMEEGEKFLTKKTREVMEFLRGKGDSEKQGYLVGAVESIREKMGRARAGEIGQFRFLETGNAKEKLRLLFPKGRAGDKQMQQLMRTLNRERVFATTQGKITEGSQTALRAAGGRVVGGQAAIPTSAEIVTHPIRGTIGAAVEAGREAIEGLKDKSIGELGKLLFSPDNAEMVIAELQRRGVPPQVIESLVAKWTRAGAAMAPAIGLGAGNVADEINLGQ